MARLNLILLAIVVVCALSVVTSQHQARKLFVELQKEQELAQAARQRVGSTATRTKHVGHACAHRKNRERQTHDERAAVGTRPGGYVGRDSMSAIVRTAADDAVDMARSYHVAPLVGGFAALIGPRALLARAKQRLSAAERRVALQPGDRIAGNTRHDRIAITNRSRSQRRSSQYG